MQWPAKVTVSQRSTLLMSASIAWLTLCGTVFALGIRHGLDADHLAIVDGLARFNFKARPRLARWCGALFSIGHGCVVITIAGALGNEAATYSVPAWAQALGAWISIVFLIVLGLLNLSIVLRTPLGEVVHPVGIRSRLLSPLTRTTRPLGIIAIGALFALSFDTLSQAVLFAATASRFSGLRSGVVLGALFTLGMLLVDGLNGAWVTTLLERADRRARIASRAIGMGVSILSFAVATLAIVRYFHPGINTALRSRDLLIGMLVVTATVVGIVLIGRVRSRRRSAHERETAAAPVRSRAGREHGGALSTLANPAQSG
jgi:high-affinity nickel-transport protein